MPQTQKRLYEIESGGQTWEIESERDLTDEDVQSALRGIGERPSPRVDSITFSGGMSAKAKKPPGVAWRDAKVPLAQPPSPGDSQEDLGNAALAGMGEGIKKMNPELRHWGESLSRQVIMPFATGLEIGDIGAQAFQDIGSGRPLMSTEPGSVGARLGNLALGMIPLRNEGQAFFTGSPQNPQGGPFAAVDALREDWANDPAGTIINLFAAGKLATHPLVKSTNGVSKTILTSADISAPGRQGAILGVNNPKAAFAAGRDMIAAIKSDPVAEQIAARNARPMDGSSPAAPVPAPTGRSTSVAVVPAAVKSPAPVAKVSPRPVRVPTGEPAPAGPTHTVEVPAAPVPSAPSMGQSGRTVRNSRPIQTSPGVYRAPSELLDEVVTPPASAAGALDRATRPDALAPVATPGQVQVPDLRPVGASPNVPVGSPVVPPVVESPAPSLGTLGGEPVPVAPAVKPRPSPTSFGLDLSSSELYSGSKVVEALPLGIGKVVRKSRIAYDTYLSSLRRGVWDDTAASLEKAGITPEAQPQVYHDLGKWISRASGVGDASLLDLAPPVRDALFAPRLTASRLEILNPMAYYKLSPPVRALAVKQVATAVASGLGVLALAKANGCKVGDDPESSDFGKVILPDGKTRYECFAGFTPYARLAALAMRGSPKTGKVLGTRAESLLAPMQGLAAAAFRGKTITGDDFDPLSETGKRFVPLVVQDMASGIRELGGVEGIFKASPSIVGVGTQIYSKAKKPVEGVPNGR